MNKRIKKKRAKLRRQKMALLRSVQSVAFLSASIGMAMAYQSMPPKPCAGIGTNEHKERV